MRENKLIIEAGRAEKQYFGDLWRYRELFVFLAWRDIAVRYKQTVLGILWAILRPFTTMVVFTVIFGRLAKMPSEGVPYAIMVFVGMLPWQFFSSAVAESSASLLGSSGMISKIYFPRLIVPTSSIIVCFVDFFISFAILAILMVYYQFLPSPYIFALPVFIFISFLASMGIGFWMSALTVKYRDFRYLVPFIVQCGLYVSPVGFSSNVIPEKWRLLYSLNPMVGVIDGFRWAIIGGAYDFDKKGFFISTFIVVIIFVTGLQYFRKTEKTFADVI